MISFPNAKINLGLYVERKRPDGYHDISTVFYPIKLQDILEIVKSEKTTLTTTGNKVDCEFEKNLVVKAYRMLEKEFYLPPVDIFLHKHIPDGAGLGGGSADASVMLRLLNDLFELGLSDQELAQRAAKIGADCPFFIYNTPKAASGIGDIFTEVDVNLKDYKIVVVKPDVYISTAAAYAGIQPNDKREYSIVDILKMPIGKWKGLLVNDFETSVFSQHPELAEVKESLYQAGAVYASMSGSGSAIYGIFDNDIMADKYVENCQIPKVFKINL